MKKETNDLQINELRKINKTDSEYIKGLSGILEKNKMLTHDESLAVQKSFIDSDHDLFDDFLIEEGIVQESDLLKALGQYYNIAPFDVTGYFFDHELITKFPKGFLLREGIIPVEVDNDIMSVVASDPDKEGLESMIKEYASYDVVFMVGIRRDICDAVKEFFDKSVSEVDYDEDLRQERQLESEAEYIEDGGKPIIED
ncbi:MAG: General secretion pathway protein E [candidate division TM6 bacterium GW2011_GWF2_30_66]|nr:MAG: General secretion pathway protein E [candidate division TM6 bacterium GW2011_GWF2_30_66]